MRYFPTAAAPGGSLGFVRVSDVVQNARPRHRWMGTSNTVSRALRLIDESALEDGGIEALAERLGIGSRHLRRLFLTHLGADVENQSPAAPPGLQCRHLQVRSRQSNTKHARPCWRFPSMQVCRASILWTTSETRTKPSFRGGGSSREVTHVAFLRCSRGANGPAIDAAGQDADEELPIEPHIAREPCLRTGFPIQSHRSHPEYAMAQKEMDVFGYLSLPTENALATTTLDSNPLLTPVP